MRQALGDARARAALAARSLLDHADGLQRAVLAAPLRVVLATALRRHDHGDDYAEHEAQQDHADADVQGLGVREPVGDQRPDLVPLVLLHEMAAVVDDRQLLGSREQ